MGTTDTTDGEDRQEMARLMAGDETALDRLMERHSQRLHHYLLRLRQHPTEAEDIAQEAFVRVFRHAPRFDPAQRFVTWLFAIATNLVRDRARRRTRHVQVSLDSLSDDSRAALHDVLLGPEPSPAEEVVRRERAQAVRDAVERLPEDLRVPLVLAEYEGLSQVEIAAVTGGTPKAVEMRLYRARQLLRRRLARWLEA